MKRPLRPSLITTTLPTFTALAGFSLGVGCTRSVPPGNPPPPPRTNPPAVADAGVPHVDLTPTRVDPTNIPVMLGGAPMVVTPMPAHPVVPAPMPAPAPAPSAPSPAPAPSAPSAPAPAAAAAAAPMAAAAPPSDMLATAAPPPGSAPGVYITHNHPPGTPCHPIAQTEIRQQLQRVGTP